ncbi:hypothetical protein C8C77_10917 [Halanaerobium saccharolyticum]|uniref:PWI domain-containing protein n=1 Tax=Halanaerobium saccharolyticum TaxID=43595 RepID=A0A4R7Z8A8_9FIRM|nr:hypothetical protein [Halanaerobium saccharolyticum]RAK07842.1 hypothetical protein C7958_11212 [Halanaerobium saccharolyticum]TDW04456.1 hypothetical protein C8C77_10917 [Halanaerobium saccharolyticum]TDX59792.1 hypothetical protein C7956_11217 [Halanaerobium saccharolyticum]
MINHYQKVLKNAEELVADLLKMQVLEANKRDHGGLQNLENKIVSPKFSIYGLKTMSSVYYNQDSIYYKDQDLFNSIKILLNYIENVQREDGTFDYLSVNFYSSPDTAFMVQRLCMSYKIIAKFSVTGAEQLKNILERVIKKAAFGMAEGGFHTPNHRWVISSALMMAYNILKIDDFKINAEKYLGEGIDCNQDGEFTERSTGIYNVVNDNALIILAEETKDWTLLEHVKRNLKMMLKFIEPDGTIYTGNSTRQDKGEKYYPDNYYHLYLYMADKLKDKEFSYMAQKIIERPNRNTDVQSFAQSLYLFMLNPELKDFDVPNQEIENNYEKFYQQSGVLRVRRDKMSFTLSENSTQFFEFKAFSLSLALKISTSFFEIGQFNLNKVDQQWQRESKTSKIVKKDDIYQMRFHSHGTYYLPFEKGKEVEWGEMNYEQRKIGREVDLYINLNFKEIENGVEVSLKTEGCDRVPLKVEFVVPANSVIEGDSFLLKGKAGNSLAAKNGEIKITKGTDTIKLDSAFAEHLYTEDMRGTEKMSEHHFTIFYTDFTNLEKSFSIKKV